MDMLKVKDINRLVEWYRENKRSFPWRDTGDPFDVWISEIMLQQTRAEVVVSYFERFRKEMPFLINLINIYSFPQRIMKF